MATGGGHGHISWGWHQWLAVGLVGVALLVLFVLSTCASWKEYKRELRECKAIDEAYEKKYHRKNPMNHAGRLRAEFWRPYFWGAFAVLVIALFLW